MSIQEEIKSIINKLDTLSLVSKFNKISKHSTNAGSLDPNGDTITSQFDKTSKFSAIIKIDNISKFADLPENVKSDLDMPIPMEVEIQILKTGENRDGIITTPELIDTIGRWKGQTIIPFHNMDDMDNITSYNISEDAGTIDGAEHRTINGEDWIIAKARITNRNIAYQMYLRELKGEPIQVSAEYKWRASYDNEGNTIQTFIRPGLISLVESGHIKGNSIKIKSPLGGMEAN